MKAPSTATIVGFIPKRHLFDDNKDNKDENIEEEEDDDQDDDEDDETKKKKRSASSPLNLTREDMEKRYPLHSTLAERARIYQFAPLEDTILLSCRASVLAAPFMSYAELRVGQVVSGVVRGGVHALNGGLNVSLSQYVRGFIPRTHTGDVPLSEANLARKLKPGASLKCRVLQLNVAEKRCVLTAKKTLVKSKLPLIGSFDQPELRVGAHTYGTVVSIQPYGLLLSFLGELKGLLPRSHLSASQANATSGDGSSSEKDDLGQLYRVGQLIQCRVFAIDRAKQLIKLSLIMDDDEQNGRGDNDTPTPNTAYTQLANTAFSSRTCLFSSFHF